MDVFQLDLVPNNLEEDGLAIFFFGDDPSNVIQPVTGQECPEFPFMLCRRTSRNGRDRWPSDAKNSNQELSVKVEIKFGSDRGWE